MSSSADIEVIHWGPGRCGSVRHRLLGEEPLSIRIQGKPYAVVMRTPGGEIEHAAGFCLSEGIVESPDDFAALACCDAGDPNVVTVTLKPHRREAVLPILERRGFISQTSCGICGKEMVDDLSQILHPIAPGGIIDAEEVLARLEELIVHQPLRRETGASHASVIYGTEALPLAAAEDVGRHNALDKAVGKIFLAEKLREARYAVLSSRISYEMVQKGARARIPVLIALSRPTALAVALARRLNLTLATLAKEGGLYIYCGEERLRR